MHTRGPRRTLHICMVIATALALVATACSSSEDEVFPDTFETYLASISYEYEPASSLRSLAARSEVVAEATLIDVEDGRIFGDSEDDPFASRHLNLVFETAEGDRYYVELARPADSSVEQLRSVFPIGSANVIYLQPNKDPLDNWFNVRADGNHWFFTTPQGWIVDHPERGIDTPLEAADTLGLTVPDRGETDLRAWLVDA